MSNLENPRFMERISTNLRRSNRLPHVCTIMMYSKLGGYRLQETATYIYIYIMYVYIYIYTGICIIYIYIHMMKYIYLWWYIYIERERDRYIWWNILILVSLMWILEKYNDKNLKIGIANLGRSHAYLVF